MFFFQLVCLPISNNNAEYCRSYLKIILFFIQLVCLSLSNYHAMQCNVASIEKISLFFIQLVCLSISNHNADYGCSYLKISLFFIQRVCLLISNYQVEYSSIYCKIGLFFIQLGSLFVHFQLVSWLAVFEEFVCFLSNWFVYQFLISNLVHYSSHMFVITGYWSTNLTANFNSSLFFIHLVCFDIQCLVLVCYLIC